MDVDLAVVTLLQWVYGGKVPTEVLENTPRRFRKMLYAMTTSCRNSLDDILDFRTFPDTNDEMIIQTGIPFWSLCEHHLVPFHGTVAVGYLPSAKVIGLSKIPRLVHYFAAMPQLQERMTTQIAETLMERLKCLGVGVIIKARHLCIEMRGAKTRSDTTTSCLLGKFRENASARAEFLGIVQNAKES